MDNLKPQELLGLGIKFLKQGKYWDALNAIKAAIEKGGYDIDNMPPDYLSYLGLATALAEKRYRDAAALCEMAVKKEFYNSVFCLNLGKVYLAGGHNRKAINAFYSGLKIDKNHKGIIEELNKMGVRRSPIVPFLARKNVLNKFLGTLIHKERKAKVRV
ncbi:MAG: tetratricopeptide repeat protein [Nitrospirae bacterium]|nr:tetratricopeptide repeat protein [Nitrospirota bacterium]